jgi:hypothetical protein
LFVTTQAECQEAVAKVERVQTELEETKEKSVEEKQELEGKVS